MFNVTRGGLSRGTNQSSAGAHLKGSAGGDIFEDLRYLTFYFASVATYIFCSASLQSARSDQGSRSLRGGIRLITESMEWSEIALEVNSDNNYTYSFLSFIATFSF